MSTIRHAVLHDQIFTILQPGRKIEKKMLREIPADAGKLFDICQQIDITHLWIMPGSFIDLTGQTFYADLQKPYSAWYPEVGDEDEQEIQCARISKEKCRNVLVFYPARGRWGWTINTAVDILATIQYLEEAIGVTCQWSPGHMAFSLLKNIHATGKHMEWMKPCSTDLAQLPFKKAARDLLWIRPGGLPQEVKGWYLHHFDKNSAYLSACQGVSVGCGDVSHTKGEGIGKMPGIHHINAMTVTYPFDGHTLPQLVTSEWVTLDLLKYARLQGYSFDIDESYIFQEGHAMLKVWAGKIWDGRASLKIDSNRFPHTIARENAYLDSKEMALIGVGKLAFKESALPHANWWADAVGKSVVTFGCNLSKFLQSGGFFLLMAYSDGIWIWSQERNPAAAVPGILDRRDALGGYKHVQTLKITEEIIQASQVMKPGEMVSYLKKAGK
jgi:hypothetical protein